MSEGKLNQQVIADRLPEEKRGRVEGWCFKKNKKTKKLVPYRCLKWVPGRHQFVMMARYNREIRPENEEVW